MHSVRKFYETIVKKTRYEIDEISRLPQRSEAWLEARKGRLTASNYGAASGCNKYCSPNELLLQLLWCTFTGNEATRYGTENEPIALQRYYDYLAVTRDKHFSISERGLVICVEHPWLAVSPDGVVTVDGYEDCNVDKLWPLPTTISEALLNVTHDYLLEIKCPARKRFYPGRIPEYYLAQTIGQMAVMDAPYLDFIVFIPKETQVTRICFNKDLWQHLFNELKQFYFGQLLPRLVLKDLGVLVENSLESSDKVIEQEVYQEAHELMLELYPENNMYPVPAK